eukprot:3612632-Amphidinium_carterae.1
MEPLAEPLPCWDLAEGHCGASHASHHTPATFLLGRSGTALSYTEDLLYGVAQKNPAPKLSTNEQS